MYFGQKSITCTVISDVYWWDNLRVNVNRSIWTMWKLLIKIQQSSEISYKYEIQNGLKIGILRIILFKKNGSIKWKQSSFKNDPFTGVSYRSCIWIGLQWTWTGWRRSSWFRRRGNNYSHLIAHSSSFASIRVCFALSYSYDGHTELICKYACKYTYTRTGSFTVHLHFYHPLGKNNSIWNTNNNEWANNHNRSTTNNNNRFTNNNKRTNNNDKKTEDYEKTKDHKEAENNKKAKKYKKAQK